MNYKWWKSLAGVLVALLAVGVGAALAAAPFVEPEAQALLTLYGEQPGDGFGWVGENLGDLDGDGVNDFITSAPFYVQDGSQVGRAYVYSGADGALLNVVTGQTDENFGFSASTAGDVNADGTPDYIVGGRGVITSAVPFLGRVVVYSGADHRVLYAFNGAPNEGFGYSARGAGDVNGDGYGDLIVGAGLASFSAFRAGRVYVFSGADGSELWHVDGFEDFDFLGSAVGLVGDLNGDGFPELSAGAYGAGPANGGLAYVFDGTNGAVLLTLEPQAWGTAVRFGQFFASGAGDVNADGLPDIFVGDYPDRRGGGLGTGRAYIFSGADGKRLYLFNAQAKGEGFGPGRGVGDVNGDGFGDVIIGAYTSSAGAPASGKAYLYSGQDGALLRTVTNTVPNEFLGVDALSLGDLNGDGLADYLLTGSGVLYLVAGVP